MDLTPAKWIWFPSQRTLACTFVLFRRSITLADRPTAACGWIVADSRYRLTVNGRRVQWGPAPCDPRHAEADPVDLSPYLTEGENVIGVEVLYYGHGDGTWPFGKPGLLMRLAIDGQELVTDGEWRCKVDRAHPPGQYKRSFLRALQEVFDARLHPYGWNLPDYQPDESWVAAQELKLPADKPSFAGGHSDYLNEVWMLDPSAATLSERSVPMLREVDVPADRLVASGKTVWRREPDDWFQFRSAGVFEIERTDEPLSTIPEGEGRYLTFAFEEEIVGWPYFTIHAPEGTIVEVMSQESHDPEAHPWLDTHFFAWSRFICREGENRFEAFDFEAVRWLQLHVRNARGPVQVSNVGVRRRMFDWPNEAHIRTSDGQLQRLFDACVNTLHNSAQDTIVDGMGRERQQYAGDGSHQLHAVRFAFGDRSLSARYLRTFGAGQTLGGTWFDSWPAYDRLARTWEREIGASGWGPLVDHSIGFCFDHYHHWMLTGELEPARQNWGRMMRFVAYLEGIVGQDGMLPVDGLGVEAVWIDHEAYQRQRHKQCAFNLYAAAMLSHGLAPLAEAVDPARADRLRRLSEALTQAVVESYWDPGELTFVNNRPWLSEEEGPRMCDRSLATAVLYGQCPGGASERSVDLLADPPENLGIGYPANALWRYHALAKGGRLDVFWQEMRVKWATMRSVIENNALQEFWTTRTDGTDLFSHCPLAPLNVLFTDVLGLRPLEPGFRRMAVRPALAHAPDLDVVAWTPPGPVRFTKTGHTLRVAIPSGTVAEVDGRSVQGPLEWAVSVPT